MTTLDAALASVVRRSDGRLVLLSSRAGIGKSALLRALCAEHQGSHRVLRGACDALFTPRPLGPFLDVVRHTGGELERLTERGARPHEVPSHCPMSFTGADLAGSGGPALGGRSEP
jgi:predicted ATPase